MDQEVQVGEPAGELTWRRLMIKVPAMRGQMHAHSIPVERYALLRRAHIGWLLIHRPSGIAIGQSVRARPGLVNLPGPA